MDIGVITAVGSSLAAAIGVLWRHVMNANGKLEIKLDECEEKHDEANGKVLELSVKVARIESGFNGYREAKDDLKKLESNVLKILNERGKK
jgi:hypothetical protein